MKTSPDVASLGDDVAAPIFEGIKLPYIGNGMYLLDLYLDPQEMSLDLGISLGTQEGETEEDFNPILGHGNKFGFSEPGYYRLTVDSSNLDAVYFSVKYIGDTSSVNIHYLPFEKADNVWGVSFDAESVFAYGTDEYITEIVFDESVADEAGYTVDVDAKYDGLNLGITVDNLENDSSIRYTILPVAQPEIWLREGYANVYSELPAEENQSCL